MTEAYAKKYLFVSYNTNKEMTDPYLLYSASLEYNKPSVSFSIVLAYAVNYNDIYELSYK